MQEHVIPWEKVVKIGVDTILVELPGEIFQTSRSMGETNL